MLYRYRRQLLEVILIRGRPVVNVLDLDAVLGITGDDERREAEKALEILILQAIKNWLNYIREQEIETTEQIENFNNGTSIPNFLIDTDHERARAILQHNIEMLIDDRRDLLTLLTALVDGSSEPG